MTPNQSLERGFALLELLDRETEGVGIRELGRRLDLHPSNVQRIIGTLVSLGYVERFGQASRYRLALKTYFLGQSLLRSDRITATAAEELDNLSSKLGLSAYLAVRRDNYAVYVHVVQGKAFITVRVSPGDVCHLHTTAMGKALMIDMTAEDLISLYPSEPLTAMTHLSITSRDALQHELQITYDRGYSMVMEENAYGIASIGAPIRDQSGHVIAAISVALPLSSKIQENIVIAAKAVIDSAEKISEINGCPIKYLSKTDQ